MKTQAQTWSNYKHYNTLKELVGISYNGIVNFASSVWTGRVSEKELIKCSGLLEKLERSNKELPHSGWKLTFVESSIHSSI